MITYSPEEVRELLHLCEETVCDQDNYGQLVFYTGVFVWADGSFHDEPDRSDEVIRPTPHRRTGNIRRNKVKRRYYTRRSNTTERRKP